MTERNQIVALKGCPFCSAGLARPMGSGLAGFSGVEVMDAMFQPYVWCGTCGARTRSCDSIAEAIEAWNTRTTDHLPTPSAEGDHRGEDVRALVKDAKAAYRKWQETPTVYPCEDEADLAWQAFSAGWHSRDKLIRRLILDADEEKLRADEALAALEAATPSTDPSPSDDQIIDDLSEAVSRWRSKACEGEALLEDVEEVLEACDAALKGAESSLRRYDLRGHYEPIETARNSARALLQKMKGQ